MPELTTGAGWPASWCQHEHGPDGMFRDGLLMDLLRGGLASC